MRTPEGREKDKIKKHLASIGAWGFSPYMTGFGKSGVPDLCACIAGKFWGIEVKRESALPTRLQILRMSEIKKAGGMAAWGTSAKVISEIELWRAQESLKQELTLGQ